MSLVIGDVVDMNLPIIVASNFIVVAEDSGEVEDSGFNARSAVDGEDFEYGIVSSTRRCESMEKGVIGVDCLASSVELLSLFFLSDVAWTYYYPPLDASNAVSDDGTSRCHGTSHCA